MLNRNPFDNPWDSAEEFMAALEGELARPFEDWWAAHHADLPPEAKAAARAAYLQGMQDHAACEQRHFARAATKLAKYDDLAELMRRLAADLKRTLKDAP